MCMYIYTYILYYIYVHKCLYVHKCMRIYINVHAYVYVCMRMRMHTDVSKNTSICTYVYIYLCRYLSLCVSACFWLRYTCTQLALTRHAPAQPPPQWQEEQLTPSGSASVPSFHWPRKPDKHWPRRLAFSLTEIESAGTKKTFKKVRERRLVELNYSWYRRFTLLPWWPLLRPWACPYVSLCSSCVRLVTGTPS